MAFFLRLFTFLFLGAWCLTPLAGHAQGTATITGKVSGKTADTVAVSLRTNPLDPREHITYARLNDKGEFRMSVPVSGPTRADLVYDDDVAELFLEPGDALEVRFKGSDLAGSVKYKGHGSEANTYLADVDEQFVENDGLQVLPDNITLYEPGFLSFLDYRRKQEEKFYERNAEGSQLSQAIRDYAKATIAYSYANDRLTYPDLREQVVPAEGRIKLSAAYYDFLNDPKLINNPGATQNELYQEFLLNYVHYLATSTNHQRTDPGFFQVCYELAKKQLSGPVQPIILGRVLQESFRFGHVKQSAAMLEDFQTFDPKNKYYPVLVHDFEVHKAFAIGAPAPDFHLVTTTGDTVSMRNFAGKLVYVNFWRTTSGLSLRDLPYAVQLAKTFEDKNIVFLNIALDENEGAWKQLVVGRKMPGVHVRASGGLRAAIAQAYGVQDVPTYFLLAEDGTFLNTKPKRLSSRAAVDEIQASFGKASTYSSNMPVK